MSVAIELLQLRRIMDDPSLSADERPAIMAALVESEVVIDGGWSA